MALEVALQLQTQHAQRRLACQHCVELADRDLDDSRRQASEGIAGRQATRSFDEGQVPQAGAGCGMRVQQLGKGCLLYTSPSPRDS